MGLRVWLWAELSYINMSSILLLCWNWHIYSTCLFILQFKTIPYPWVWILWILQGLGWIREYHCIPIIRPETILLIYLCAPMWLRYKVFFIPTNVSGFLDSSVLSFDHQPLDWGGKKSISAQRGGETQPVIEFMDVLCERWGFHNCMKHLNNHTWSWGTAALQVKRGAAICWGPMRGTAARGSFN